LIIKDVGDVKIKSTGQTLAALSKNKLKNNAVKR
jgi:hypothetical protein